MQTLSAFIAGAGLSMTATRADSNPHLDGGADMDHWRCILRVGWSRMTVYFSKGRGHNGAEPTAAEVLDCLASDASGYENAEGFEDWCAEYGYDTDSRKAEKTFRTIKRQAARFRAFLGDSAYETLLWKTERL